MNRLRGLLVSSVMFASPYAVGGATEDRAQALFDGISGGFNTPGKLANSFQNPLLSEGGALPTLDGESTFETGVLCSASNNYLVVSGETSDEGETHLRVRFDTDLDGLLDTDLTLENVSGYCANGYIQCTPGTWSSCHHALWQMDSSGFYTVAVPAGDTDVMKLSLIHI